MMIKLPVVELKSNKELSSHLSKFFFERIAMSLRRLNFWNEEILRTPRSPNLLYILFG